MARTVSIDHLLERWSSSGGPNATTSLEELCSGRSDEVSDFRDRLRAISSMISSLGLAPTEPATSEEPAGRDTVALGPPSGAGGAAVAARGDRDRRIEAIGTRSCGISRTAGSATSSWRSIRNSAGKSP